MDPGLTFVFGNPSRRARRLAKSKRNVKLKAKRKPMKRRKRKARKSSHGPKKRRVHARRPKRARKAKRNPAFKVGESYHWLPGKEAVTKTKAAVKAVRGLLKQAKTPGKKNRIRVLGNQLFSASKRWDEKTKETYAAVKAGKVKGDKVTYFPVSTEDKKNLDALNSALKALKSGKASGSPEAKKIASGMAKLAAAEAAIAKASKKGPKVAKKKRKKKAKKAKTHKKAKRARKPRKAKKAAAPKKARKKARRKSRKGRRYSSKHKAAHHKIGESIDRLGKGKSAHVRHKGHGKKARTYKVRRINPSRKRNPGEIMLGKANAVKDALVKKTGHSGAELGGLAAGGALIAVLPKIVDSISAAIGMPSLGTYARQYYGNSVLIPLALGMAVNHYAKGDKAKAIGSGIAAAAVVNAGIAATQYVASMAGMPLSGYVAAPFGGYVADSKTMRGLKKSIDFQGYKAFAPGSGDFNGMGSRYFGADTNGYIASNADFKGKYFGGEYTDGAEDDSPEDGSGSAQMG